MAREIYQRRSLAPTTGTFDTLVAGSRVASSAITVGDQNTLRTHDVTAKVTVLAETNGLTLTGLWQVSNDNVTWLDVANGTQNAAGVALATGTAGADSPVTRVFTIGESVYGYKFARFALITGGATGTASDTYSITPCFMVMQ